MDHQLDWITLHCAQAMRCLAIELLPIHLCCQVQSQGLLHLSRQTGVVEEPGKGVEWRNTTGNSTLYCQCLILPIWALIASDDSFRWWNWKE